ncbi:copine family protein [Nitzschia inconspicua]|uniref:Copine family protein n=1 Tax=Nitzschia inconspicua TaxID=303405 RepID=A0A9K3P7X2_9STRA|nr:copine family protein [Nitzschia inconspicua]KAG7368866.1 copine family protein [Nitzschia inconspicua]
MTSRLQVSLSAQNLRNLSGYLSKSDPFAVVTVRGDNPDNRPEVVGRTDVVFNNLNPNWATIVFLEGYKFGVPFYIEVGVFDFDAKAAGTTEAKLQMNDAHTNLHVVCDASSRNLLRNGQFPHRVMGTALFEVGEILASRGNVGSKSLQTGGAVYAHIERCREDGAHGKFRFQMRAFRLKNVQTLGRTSSPFFELLRKVDRPTGATWVKVYQSNVVRSDLHPVWNDATLDLEAVCNGDLNRAMKIILWDHRRSGKHKHMGEFETTVNGLLNARELDANGEIVTFTVMKYEKAVGTCEVMKASIIGGQPRKNNGKPQEQASPPSPITGPSQAIIAPDVPEFIDYLTGGCQISLAVAIDFTASNGDPRQEGTPHYFHPPASKEWNDYEKAIFAVGSILAKYDADQRFPVWGFGAKYNNVVRHCFQCGNEVEVEGVQGIMDAYRGVFRTPLTMSYPTKFTEVIATAASYARHEQEVAHDEGKLSYTILLILTAGNVEDVQETKQHLIEASKDPLSIVIVGIGDTDFSGMEFLDSFDDEHEDGRDITKFVRFNDYKSYNALTEAVLDEIPGQLVDYYYSRGILPGTDEGYSQEDVEIQPADDDERTFTFLG